MIVIEGKEIPSDLMKYFEPVRMREKQDVLTISTKPFHGAHFATFPPGLVEPCVLAGTSERGVCPACGAPWERVVDRVKGGLSGERTPKTARRIDKGFQSGKSYLGQPGWRKVDRPSSTTIGWRPTCACDAGAPVPATVLDPFAGSGTVGVVCQEHGRRFVGVDISEPYLRKQARERLGLLALAAWTGGRRVGKITADAPLFDSVISQEMSEGAGA